VAEPLRSRQRRARRTKSLFLFLFFVLIIVMKGGREGHPSVNYRDAALFVGDGQQAAVVVDLGTERRKKEKREEG